MQRKDITVGGDYAVKRSKWAAPVRTRVLGIDWATSRGHFFHDYEVHALGETHHVRTTAHQSDRYPNAVLVQVYAEDGLGLTDDYAVVPSRSVLATWGDYRRQRDEAEVQRIEEQQRQAEYQQQQAERERAHLALVPKQQATLAALGFTVRNVESDGRVWSFGGDVRFETRPGTDAVQMSTGTLQRLLDLAATGARATLSLPE